MNPRSGRGPLQDRRHSQFRVKVTKLLVDFYVTVPALQFGHSPLVFIPISLVDTVKDSSGELFILRDDAGVHSGWEGHRGCLRALSPGPRVAGHRDGETISRPPPLPARVTPTLPTHVSPGLPGSLLLLHVKSSAAQHQLAQESGFTEAFCEF